MNYKELLEYSRNQLKHKEQVASYKEQYLDSDLPYTRLANIARKHNIKTLRQLMKVKNATVQKWKGIGPKTMEDLLYFKEELTHLR